MRTARGQVQQAHNGHLAALQAKHEALEHKIKEEMKHPAASTATIKRLKAEKLLIKDEIEQELES